MSEDGKFRLSIVGTYGIFAAIVGGCFWLGVQYATIQNQMEILREHISELKGNVQGVSDIEKSELRLEGKVEAIEDEISKELSRRDLGGDPQGQRQGAGAGKDPGK